jgi:hypothetical protein
MVNTSTNINKTNNELSPQYKKKLHLHVLYLLNRN